MLYHREVAFVSAAGRPNPAGISMAFTPGRKNLFTGERLLAVFDRNNGWALHAVGRTAIHSDMDEAT